MHFRQFSPNLHNIFVQEAVLCRELEKSPSCMDYPIRTSPEYVLFLCRTRLKRASCIPARRFDFEVLAQKQVPAAICITFHSNFTIRPGGHSNFRRFPPFPVSCSASAFRFSQISICSTAHFPFNNEFYVEKIYRTLSKILLH